MCVASLKEKLESELEAAAKIRSKLQVSDQASHDFHPQYIPSTPPLPYHSNNKCIGIYSYASFIYLEIF